MTDQDNSSSSEDLLAEFGLPDISGIPIPTPVKRSLLKALSRLIVGTVEVPVAYLEAKARSIRAQGAAKDAVTLAAAKSAADRFTEDPVLSERAVHYFGEQILRTQINREEIARATIEAITANPPQEIPSNEIDDDWLTEFAEISAKKSNTEIRAILGRILAGEISNPGTFSPATLQLFTILSQSTARKFQTICGMSMVAEWFTFIITEPFPDYLQKGFNKLGISYSDLLELQSYGLLMPALSSQLELDKYGESYIFDFVGQDIKLHITDSNKSLPDVGICVFSPIGHELRSVIPLEKNVAYDKILKEWLHNKSVEIVTV